jgi:hypothetical protein
MLDMLAIASQLDQLDDELSQADAVLPVQFHNGHAGTATAEPLRRLMVAILVDAIRCFQNKSKVRRPAGRQEFAEIRSWIFCDDGNGCFSFRAVCDALEIDPKAIRKRLTEWEETCAGDKSRSIIRRSGGGCQARFKIMRYCIGIARRRSRLIIYLTIGRSRGSVRTADSSIMKHREVDPIIATAIGRS